MNRSARSDAPQGRHRCLDLRSSFECLSHSGREGSELWFLISWEFHWVEPPGELATD